MSEWALYKMLQLHTIITKRALFWKLKTFTWILPIGQHGCHAAFRKPCRNNLVLTANMWFCLHNKYAFKSELTHKNPKMPKCTWLNLLLSWHETSQPLAPCCHCLGRSSLLRLWWGTGAGCLQKLWVPHHWKYSRPGWQDPEQPVLVSGMPACGRKVGTRQGLFQTKSFCDLW